MIGTQRSGDTWTLPNSFHCWRNERFSSAVQIYSTIALRERYPRGSAVGAAIANDPTLAERADQAKQIASGRKQLREAVLINCWHINDHESAAMWKLYARSDKGISIKSTVQRLTDALKCKEEVWVGAVQYLDYDAAVLPSPSPFSPFER